jgi:uncharacterized protein (TIGR02001 family)
MSLIAALAGTAGCAFAQDATSTLNGYVTLASGYWSYGLSQNDGASLQGGIDFEHRSGWFVGARAANVSYEIEYSYAEPRDIEANVYGGYHRRGTNWSWAMTAARYYYPGTAISYDYNEVSGTVGFNDRVFYTASYSDDFYGSLRSSLNQELSFALPLRGDIEIGAVLGRFRLSSSDVDYTHWNFGVSKVLRRVALDLRYYDSGYDAVSWLGDPNANQTVLSVSYALRGSKPRI